MLLFAGVFVYIKKDNANFALSLFGLTTLEEIFFSWLGLITNYLPAYAIAPFFCCAVITLLIAYSNVFELKRLSISETIFSFLIGAIVSFLPNFL
jgi:hypothetical protein